jgi:hypothetical protein
MSEEKKEGSCCSSGGCGKGIKLLAGLLIAAFIFASGMWFEKSKCAGHSFCPFTAPASK